MSCPNMLRSFRVEKGLQGWDTAMMSLTPLKYRSSTMVCTNTSWFIKSSERYVGVRQLTYSGIVVEHCQRQTDPELWKQT